MLSEVMEHYGLAFPFDEAGFFETEHHRKVVKQMKAAIQAGRLVALSGLVALTQVSAVPEALPSRYWCASNAKLLPGSSMPSITVALGVPYQSWNQVPAPL